MTPYSSSLPRSSVSSPDSRLGTLEDIIRLFSSLDISLTITSHSILPLITSELLYEVPSH